MTSRRPVRRRSSERYEADVRRVYEIDTAHRIFAKRIDAAQATYQTKIEAAQCELKRVFDESKAERDQVLAEKLAQFRGAAYWIKRWPIEVRLQWQWVLKDHIAHYAARCRDAWLELMDAWMKAASNRVTISPPVSTGTHVLFPGHAEE